MLKILDARKLISNVILIVGLALYASQIRADVTPSDVYHTVSIINAEIKLIRAELGVTKEAHEPALQSNKMPVHVYSKSLELLKKVSKLQQKHGVEARPLPQIPIQDISPEQVQVVVETIHDEVIRVKKQLGISQAIADIEFYPNRTPSNVYEEIWVASYLIDGMIEPISPTEVFKNTLRVQSELNLIADHLKVDLPDVAERPQPGKTPKRVHLRGYINLHKFSLFEKKLKMKALRVPTYPKTKISPSDVYDITDMMLAEINRIKFHLGIVHNAKKQNVTGRKRPSHVLAQMNLINDQIEYLTGITQ